LAGTIAAIYSGMLVARTTTALLAIVSVLCGACTSKDQPPAAPVADAAGSGGSTGDADGSTTCHATKDVEDIYVAQLKKSGTQGALTFELVASDPAPPQLGASATWTLRVTTAQGTPFTGKVTGELKMPYHNHPVTIQPSITLVDAASGLYTANPVYFFMPGYWRAAFSALDESSDAGLPLDVGTFYFCIE
jgi:hypothetical protein